MFRSKLSVIFPAILALPVATALSGEAQAKDVTLNNGDTVTLPDCQDNKGVDVRFQFLRVVNPQEPDFVMAQSMFHPMQGPLVQFKPEMKDMPADVVKYAAAHECYHHIDGHAREIFMNVMTTGSVNLGAATHHEYELAADCYAAEVLQTNDGFDEAAFRRVFSYIPEAPHSGTHPSNAERMERVLQCTGLLPS